MPLPRNLTTLYFRNSERYIRLRLTYIYLKSLFIITNNNICAALHALRGGGVTIRHVWVGGKIGSSPVEQAWPAVGDCSWLGSGMDGGPWWSSSLIGLYRPIAAGEGAEGLGLPTLLTGL